MSAPASALPALAFLSREGLLLQAYFVQVQLQDESDSPLDLERLEGEALREALTYYGACWFGGSFFLALLSDVWLPSIASREDYPSHVDWRSWSDDRLEAVMPAGHTYHCYLETEHEAHHFALLCSGDARHGCWILSSYDEQFVVARAPGAATAQAVAERLVRARDAAFYRSLFWVPFAYRHRSAYSRADLFYRREPLRWPTKDRVEALIERLRGRVAGRAFSDRLDEDRGASEEPDSLQTQDSLLAALGGLSEELKAEV